jgi:hypothetical protein
MGNWYLEKQLDRLKHMGHNYIVVKINGNQILVDQKGTEFAVKNGYDLCYISDDDMIHEAGFFKKGVEFMDTHADCGCMAGYTLLPWMSREAQYVPDYFINHPDFSGKFESLKAGGYYPYTLVNPKDNSPKTFELLFGGFFYRPQEALAVGGFPTYMSRMGNRGEMILQTAIQLTGKKNYLYPDITSWHYSAPFGGLKLVQGQSREECLKNDDEIWEKFIARKLPDTTDPRIPKP